MEIVSPKPVAVAKDTAGALIAAIGGPQPGTFSWTSSNSSIAAIQGSTSGSSVTITGITPGTATVTTTFTCQSGATATDTVEINVVEFEIFEVNTPSDTGTPPADNSFLAPSDQITVKARVVGAPQLNSQISWQVLSNNAVTGPATPSTAANSDIFIFNGRSLQPTSGSLTPNDPLGYEAIARVIVNGITIEDRVPPLSLIRQDTRDVIRQEYNDHQSVFQPERNNFTLTSRFNHGNYEFIAEENKENLNSLSRSVNTHANTLLNNDVQEIPVGTAGLAPTDVVVDPGPDILAVGPLGDTDPQGDDVCAALLENGRCNAAIHAGINGIAETTANNRNVTVDITISSAYRNPQRSVHPRVGSTANSRHVRGRAIDYDPRGMNVPGKTAVQMMCIVEHAGDLASSPDFSFAEGNISGGRVPCNFTGADFPDHVHIQN